MGELLIPGYFLRQGSSLDRALLVKFMQRTYRELYPDADFAHLAQTVDRYLSSETQLWWVDPTPDQPPLTSATVGFASVLTPVRPQPVACLWVGSAVEQVKGGAQAYIFLLYVASDHRQQGIGTALMAQAEMWAVQRGDRQISLQVFCQNQPAIQLYQKLGYRSQSLLMTKPLSPKR